MQNGVHRMNLIKLLGIEAYSLKDAESYMSSEQINHFKELLIAWKEHLLQSAGNTATYLQNDENQHPEIVEYEWIDDVFRVWETRFGLWSSETKQGRKMLTGLTKESVIEMTRWHLKCEQDGTLDQYTRVVNSGVVGGKL